MLQNFNYKKRIQVVLKTLQNILYNSENNIIIEIK
jgi:hypothetical protein